MANEEFTKSVFKKRLKDGNYNSLAGALKAIGRGQVMDEKEKESARRLATKHFEGVKPARKKTAKKSAKKTAKAKFGPGKGRKPKAAKASRPGVANPKGSKSAFIMSQPLDMPPRDVVQAAAKYGIEVTAQYVSNLRSAAKGSKATKKAAKKTAKAAKPAAEKPKKVVRTPVQSAPKRTPKQGKPRAPTSVDPNEMTSAQIRKHPVVALEVISRVIGTNSDAIHSMKVAKELLQEVDIASDVSFAAKTIGRAIRALDNDVVSHLSVEGNGELKFEDLSPEEQKAVEILQRTRPGILTNRRRGNGAAEAKPSKSAPAEQVQEQASSG